MASSPQKNLQFISPPKEAGDFLQNQVKRAYRMCDKPFFCKLQTKNIFVQNILTKKFLSKILLSKMIPCPLLPVHASKRGGELYVHIEKGRIALAGYAALYAESDVKILIAE